MSLASDGASSTAGGGVLGAGGTGGGEAEGAASVGGKSVDNDIKPVGARRADGELFSDSAVPVEG